MKSKVLSVTMTSMSNIEAKSYYIHIKSRILYRSYTLYIYVHGTILSYTSNYLCLKISIAYCTVGVDVPQWFNEPQT